MDEDFSGLLRRAKGGETGALDELFARYRQPVLGRVRCRLSPALRRRCDSADIVQSVFEDVIRELPAFEDRGEEAFRHWLYLKAEHKVNDKWRRLKHRDGGLREERLRTDDGDRAPAAGRGPATEAGENDDGARLREVLQTMEPSQREIIELRDVQGLAWAVIADSLGLTAAAARMRHSRALRALTRRWKG